MRERGLSQALADVVFLYLGEKLEKSEQASDWSAPTLSDEQLAYALKDSAIVLRLKDAMLERILELGMKAVAELEGRAILEITWCEDSGIALDEAEWLRLASDAEDRAARAKMELGAAAPEHHAAEEWNWGSQARVARALELLGFDTDDLPKTDGGKPSTTEEAESYKKAFFATYPGLTNWHVRERNKANVGRDLVRTPLGRMRKVSLAYRPWHKGWAPYFPERINAPVQDAGADAIKSALALLYDTRREQPGDPFPVDVVHDDIVLEVAAEHAEWAEAWVSECLVRGARQVTEVPDLPVKVETRIVKSFGEK